MITRIKNAIALYRDALLQAKRFNRYYTRDYGTKDNAEVLITFYSHQIEKGLSHINLRKGFGRRPLANLAKAMNRFISLSNDREGSTPYQSALAALGEYVAVHRDCPEALDYINKLFSKETIIEATAAKRENGGSIVVRRQDAVRYSQLSFSDLIAGRHSVREYSRDPISYEEIVPIVEEAIGCPSACNRQPYRVRILTDCETIARALELQGGFGGYECPPALVLITFDCRSFVGPHERNEGYIDAGMFAMTLLYALEEHNLAACPLNTMMRHRKERATRMLLNIKESELLVLYIAIGRFPDEIKTCRSRRFSVDDIVLE